MQNTVLITGASAGLGEEFSWQLATQGFNLLLVARRHEKLQQLKSLLDKQFPQQSFVSLPLDLNQENAFQIIVSFIATENIQLMGLINNAGFGSRGSFETLSAIRQREMLQVNIVALSMLTHATLENLKRVEQSFIINVASTAAFQAGPNLALYYASKAFVLSFSEALHEELHGQVYVSALCPGATNTEFAEVANMANSLAFKLRVTEKQPVVAYALSKRHRAIVIPGMMNKIAVMVVKVLPRFMSRKLAYQVQK